MTEIKFVFEGKNVNLRTAFVPPAQADEDSRLLRYWRDSSPQVLFDVWGSDCNEICVLDSEEEIQSYRSSCTSRDEVSHIFILEKKNGSKIGFAYRMLLDKRMEIGCYLIPEERNKGFAFDAVEIMAKYWFIPEYRAQEIVQCWQDSGKQTL